MNINKLVINLTTVFCIVGVIMVSNIPLVSAYEAHVMNVTANIIDNSVSINPNGGKFCNDGKLKIEITTKLAGAAIYYTTNGTEPVCSTNGTLYSAPFTLLTSKTIKAVSCYNGKQSLTATQSFEVSQNYCETSLKINKVYYNPDKAHMVGTCNNENEWVEIYNPTKEAINLKNWKICDDGACDYLATADLLLTAKGYAVVTYRASTWNYWNVPSDVTKITLNNAIGSGLNNTADMLFLKNSSGQIVDQMNWGVPSSAWANYNSDVWNPAIANVVEGRILGRNPNGYDTNQPSDWKVFSLPTVTVNYPNGGETLIVGGTYNIKWTAVNPNGNASNLKIDLYYSTDSGSTWANIIKDTDNDSVYEWRVPLVMQVNGSNYFTPSSTARIKVVATDYTTNFMLSASDASDKDFCPPIDKSLLTDEELKILETMNLEGVTIINSGKTAGIELNSLAQTDNNTDSSDNTVELKQSPVISKNDNEEDIVAEDVKDDEDNKGKKDEESETLLNNSDEDKAEETLEVAASVAAESEEATVIEAINEKQEDAKIVVEEIKEDEEKETAVATEQKDVNNDNVSLDIDDLSITPDENASIEFNLNA